VSAPDPRASAPSPEGDAGGEPGPLALVGGDELKPGNEPQDEVLVAAAGAGPAFVVPTAAAKQDPAAAVRNARRWFDGLGLDVDELRAVRRADARSKRLADRARGGRFFYLVGGDPGVVASVLAGTPVWGAIVEAWLRGAALGASSAGAMALGAWTLLRGAGPSTPRRYVPALGLVPRSAVLPHFDTFGHRWADDAVATAPDADAVLIGLDERTAAVWHEGAWRAMGAGGITVLRGGARRRYAAGDLVSGLPHPVGRYSTSVEA
jgi:cyanophycinase